MKNNTATLSIPVRYAYRPNVYLSATLTRSVPTEAAVNGEQSPLPARAFGVIPLKIDETRRRLSVEMSLEQTDDNGRKKNIPLFNPSRDTTSAGDSLQVSESENNAVTVRPKSEITIAFQVHGRRSWQKYDVCIAGC